jgi:hypothetical protein
MHSGIFAGEIPVFEAAGTQWYAVGIAASGFAWLTQSSHSSHAGSK